MQNLTDRQQQIHEWLQSQRTISIEEIQERFGVSAPTAYRDARALIENSLALKTNRGVKLPPSIETPVRQDNKCSFCGGEINPRTMFIFQMQDGSQRSACCPHCGMMALGQSGVTAALASDFLYGRMVNARQASFLLESSVSLCCEPSVLCFASEDEAQHFQQGFGGKIYTLEQAAQRVNQLMTLPGPGEPPISG
jgi:hypothetical protein